MSKTASWKIKLLCIPAPVEGVRIPELEPFDPQQWPQEIKEFGDYNALDDWFVEMREHGVVDVPPKRSQAFSRRKKSNLHIPSGMAFDILSTDEQWWAVALVVTTGGAKTNRRMPLPPGKRGGAFGLSVTASTHRMVISPAAQSKRSLRRWGCRIYRQSKGSESLKNTKWLFVQL